MKQRGDPVQLPKGFWPLIIGAVALGNAAMVLLLWLGAPDWLAIPAPTIAVGIAGVIVELRKNRARRRSDADTAPPVRSGAQTSK